MTKVVIATGGFDPLHIGHINYLNAARKLGDILLVGVNSDEWLVRKKGKAFLSFNERLAIIGNLKTVGHAFAFDDTDDTAINAIHYARKLYPSGQLIFVNGGDRKADNIPEMIFDNVEYVFGVGGSNKDNSSSWLLEEWKAPKTNRPWGYYRVLHDVNGTKVKELTIEPGQSLSMQKHEKRSEYWIVTEGECKIEKEHVGMFLRKHETVRIPVGDWHQLSNPFDNPCRIVEIQYGAECIESDIERKLD